GPASGNGFVAVRLVGGNQTAAPSKGLSNRDGVGALVSVTSGGETLQREIHAGEGFAAQNASTLLVVLGKNPAAAKVAVRWPSGVTSEAADVAAGTLLT